MLRSRSISSAYLVCVSVVSLLFSCSLALAEAPKKGKPPVSGTYSIDQVEVEGNSRVDSAAIKLQLKATSGRMGDDVIADGIKAIFKTGFFDQVTARVETSSTKPYKTLLIYSVVEKPLVRKVFIKGNSSVDEKDLTDIIKFDGQRFLDKNKIAALMRNAVSYYQTRGFYDAAFEYSVVAVGDNQVDVTFTVTEGARYKIRSVKIRGLKEADESDVIGVMQTRRYKWWSSWLMGTGRLNRAMLENDKGLMRQYFLDNGFVDANISDPTIDISEGKIEITFDVDEGKLYKVGSITASGDLLEGGVEKTLEGIKSKQGETFGAAKVRDDSFIISDKFSDTGYAFTNVVPNTTLHREEGTVDLDYSVNRGNLVHVNRINIRGNDKTYDNVIRRELKIGEQELFSGTKIKRSQELLQRLGYFEEVTIGSEPAPQKPDQVDLNVNVREASTGSFSAGAGFSSSDGALFNAKLSENNILGTGRSASINADLGTQRDNLTLAFTDRRVNDSRVGVGAEAFRTNREYTDFDRRLLGGAVSAGYPLEDLFGEWAQNFSSALKYEYLDIEISDVDPNDAAQLVIDSQGRSTSSAIIPSIQRNSINNPLNPTKGSQQSVSFEYSGLGGDEEYHLLEASQVLYQPLLQSEYGDLTFSWRTKLGYGVSDNDDPFPLFKRYFPGGINSVRGYKNRRLGPKDANGNEYGGAKQLINNFELIFPLINSAGLRGVVFYDAGEAFDDNQNIRIEDLRRAYGYGIRWTSPLGPIRIEFGFPIDKREGETSMVTLFSFGAPF